MLEAALERIAYADITAIITPALSHIENQIHRIRRACELLTIHPPASYTRQHPQSRLRPNTMETT
ncbi:hypothetical protein [Nocardia sp. R7R-8]|uniref:hypothetical protein n=1 Tax=Nocardia sp. R7R-8 TaxID=3459304 RepID=UPI00403D8226